MRRTGGRRHLLAGLLVLLLAGCAGQYQKPQEPLVGTPVELTTVPFFPQKKYQCGPAALATLLAAAGVRTSPDELASRVFLPGRRGSLQSELIAVVRGYDRVPVVVEPKVPTLINALQAGRPVLVLQDLGLAGFAQYHYAVVVGAGPDSFILRSGTSARLVMERERFVHAWERAGSWGVVALLPGEFPPGMDREVYLRAAADLEAAGRWEAAATCYQALINQWPAYIDALFGLGTVRLLQKEYQAAIPLLRQVLILERDHSAAVNNLAEALAGAGCFDEGLQVLDRFLGGPAGEAVPGWRATLAATRAELHERASLYQARRISDAALACDLARDNLESPLHQ